VSIACWWLLGGGSQLEPQLSLAEVLLRRGFVPAIDAFTLIHNGTEIVDRLMPIVEGVGR